MLYIFYTWYVYMFYMFYTWYVLNVSYWYVYTYVLFICLTYIIPGATSGNKCQARKDQPHPGLEIPLVVIVLILLYITNIYNSIPGMPIDYEAAFATGNQCAIIYWYYLLPVIYEHTPPVLEYKYIYIHMYEVYAMVARMATDELVSTTT